MTAPTRITVVCSGNICRSPMGEVILRSMFQDAGLGDVVTVTSGGMGGWHAGDGADPRTVAVLRTHGYDGSAHVARQVRRDWFDRNDLILAADSGHVRELRGLARTEADRTKIRRLREFDRAAVRAGTLDVADPWYGDRSDFEVCLREVEAACRGVVAHVQEALRGG
jgi:protein-tyrosine phosphatase